MIRKWTAVLAAALLVFLTAGCLAEETKTVCVTGTATVMMDADSASVSLGVVSVAKEAGEASRQNAEQVERLISALEEAGIPRKDISTNYYYVETRRNFNSFSDDGEYPIVGYEVGNSLTVIVRDLDRAGAVIDLALANGANSCNGLSFSTTKAGEARDQALTAAVAEGQRRAEIVAAACGGELGEILSVREQSVTGGAVINNKRSAVEAAADTGAGTAILSDGLSFTATVEITFALK